MIIKNTYGKRIFIGFVAHGRWLEPNQLTDVPETVVQNDTFRRMENLGQLEIISYNPDQTRFAVLQEVKPVLDDHETRIDDLEAGAGGFPGVPIDFKFWRLPASILNADLYTEDILLEKQFSSNVSVTKATIKLSTPVTAGTITCTLYKNAGAVPEFTMNISAGDFVAHEELLNTINLIPTDKLSAKVTTTGVAPADTVDMLFEVYAQYT